MSNLKLVLCENNAFRNDFKEIFKMEADSKIVLIAIEQCMYDDKQAKFNDSKLSMVLAKDWIKGSRQRKVRCFFFILLYR